MTSPRAVAATVLLVYAAWTGAFLATHHSVLAFIHLGSRFASHAPAGSPVAAALSDPSVTDVGYDGQFVYYEAVMWQRAECCMDSPPYRMARVGASAAAWVLALGRPAAIPYTMLASSLLALLAGTLAIADWLRRRAISPWWAGLWAFFPGMFTAFQTDENNVLAYALVALAIWTLDSERRLRVLLSGCLFAAAALTRETTLLFPAVFGFGLIAGRGRGPDRPAWAGARDGVLLGALAMVPFALLKGAVAARYGSLGIGFSSGGGEIATTPLGGLLSFAPLEPREWIEVVALVVPSTVIAMLALYRLRRPEGRTELSSYLVHYLVLVILLQRAAYFSYFDAGRIQTGVITALLFALPVLLGRREASQPGLPRNWPSLAMALAVLLWFSVVPVGLLAPHTFHALKL